MYSVLLAGHADDGVPSASRLCSTIDFAVDSAYLLEGHCIAVVWDCTRSCYAMGKPDMWNRLVRVMQGLNVVEYPLLPRKSKLEVIGAIAQGSLNLALRR